MNKFEDLIQAVREKLEANPIDTPRPQKAAKDRADTRPAERRFKLPYSSNPRPLSSRWKQPA